MRAAKLAVGVFISRFRKNLEDFCDISSLIERNAGLIDVNSRVSGLWRAIIGAQVFAGRILIYLSVPISIDFDEPDARGTRIEKPLHAAQGWVCLRDAKPTHMLTLFLSRRSRTLSWQLVNFQATIVFGSKRERSEGEREVWRMIIENVKIVEGCAFNEQLEWKASR